MPLKEKAKTIQHWMLKYADLKTAITNARTKALRTVHCQANRVTAWINARTHISTMPYRWH